MLSTLVFLPFAGAPAGLLARLHPRNLSGWLLALLPLTIFVLFGLQIPAITGGAVISETYSWVPSLGLELVFRLDGLSLLFALLVSGIGTLIVLYTGYYLAGDPGIGRFYLALLIFMGSMLGLVLSGNILTMFVFWELTSVSSYLLVGYKHEYPEARRGAQMGLLITAGGGLALLVGLLLLGEAAGSYNFAEILVAGEQIKASALYTPALLLIFLGCFTKSAQFPFHFWLPNAMQAPTPASAYLHSATMVKAGVYLLARLHPALSETPLWTYTLTIIGGTTLLMGSVIALRKHDIKALLAYSTISQLGALTMLAGLGGHDAQKALVAGILAHALYKGGLFMLAGIIDHEAHTRDLRKLGGLRKEMPATMIFVALASLSMAGIPIMFGFVAKEYLLKGAIYTEAAPWLSYAALTAIVVSAAFGVAYSWRMFSSVFLGQWRGDPHSHAHEAPAGMLAGPATLASLSLVLSFFLPAVSTLLAPAATAVAGEEFKVEFLLYQGINLALVLSATAIIAGVIMTRFERQLVTAPSLLPGWFDSDRIYDASVDGLLGGTTALTRRMQAGRMRVYVLVTILGILALVGTPFVLYGLDGVPPPDFSNLNFYEVLAALLIPVGVLATITARSRLGAIIAVSVVGAMVALLFVVFSAPDLALTQLLIEVLATVFLLFVFSVLPSRFERLSNQATRVRDGIVALIVGLMMGGLTYAAAANQQFERIAGYFMNESLPSGQGGNVVNVILVDFRGIDTLGEITVLFIATLGIYGLLRMRQQETPETASEEQPADADQPVPEPVLATSATGHHAVDGHHDGVQQPRPAGSSPSSGAGA